MLREVGDDGNRGGIVGRAHLERRDVGGRPRDAPSLGHEPRGEGERVRDQEVRTPVHGRQGILVGLPQGRQDPLAKDMDRAPAEVHDPPHRDGVVQEFEVGPQGAEAQPERLDLPAIAFAGRHHRLMAPRLEAQGDGDEGMHVAQRADRREDDPPARRLGPWRCRLCRRGHVDLPGGTRAGRALSVRPHSGHLSHRSHSWSIRSNNLFVSMNGGSPHHGTALQALAAPPVSRYNSRPGHARDPMIRGNGQRATDRNVIRQRALQCVSPGLGDRMMADATDRGKGIRRIWVALTAFAVIATAIWVFYFRPRQARKPIGVIASQIEHGDDLQRMLAIQGLYGELSGPDEFAQVFPHLIRAMKDESPMVREAAASVVGDLILRFGSNNLATDERNPTIVALCPRAEEALAILLDESSPTRGCDLQLMSSVTDATGIPTAGKSLIIVAAVDHRIHFRIFGDDGKVVVDTDETRLMERAPRIETLRKPLESLWPPHELTKSEKDEVITAVTPIVDRIQELRARAAKSLGFVAEIGKLDAPPPRLVACLDDEGEQVRMEAAKALIWYRQGPELLVPVALRRLPGETSLVREAFTDVFWFVRLDPSVLPLLIEGLSSENTDVRLSCTAAINHMGRDARPALPDILTLIRKELATPPRRGAPFRERIIAMASGAIGELSPDTDPLPGTVELLCEVLKRPSETGQVSDPNRPVRRPRKLSSFRVNSDRPRPSGLWESSADPPRPPCHSCCRRSRRPRKRPRTSVESLPRPSPRSAEGRRTRTASSPAWRKPGRPRPRRRKP